MNSNVTEIARGRTLRKIKSLERSIKTYKEIISIKQDYLNKLQNFNKYSNINKQCHDVDDQINQLTFELGVLYSSLEKLKKELNE